MEEDFEANGYAIHVYTTEQGRRWGWAYTIGARFRDSRESSPTEELALREGKITASAFADELPNGVELPVVGARYITGHGTVYVVESVVDLAEDEEPGFSVELVEEAHAEDMGALGLDFIDVEFRNWCATEYVRKV